MKFTVAYYPDHGGWLEILLDPKFPFTELKLSETLDTIVEKFDSMHSTKSRITEESYL